MRVRLVLLAASLLLVGLLAVATTGLGNAAGAPKGTSANGCTCHSASASTLATVAFVDPPSAYAPGANLTLTLRVTGQQTPTVSNQGGLAVSVDKGTLVAPDAKTQVREGMLTHTSAGNDQRIWTFGWVAPDPADGAATFSFAANAVNGDMLANPADFWQRGTLKVEPEAAVPPPTSAPAPSSPGDATPSLHVAAVLAAGLVGAWARRRPG